MKKFLVLVSIFCLSFGLFAAASKLMVQKAEQTLAKKPNDYFAKLRIAIYKADFPADKAAFDTYMDNYIKANPSDQGQKFIKICGTHMIARYAIGLNNKNYLKTALQISTAYDHRQAKVQIARALKVSQKELNGYIFDLFSSPKCKIVLINDFKKVYFDTLINIDVATAKSQLETLNRIYSRKLLTDKATWETFIAEIRTTLETYK